MVRRIQEQITRLYKVLVTPKEKDLEAQYADSWFPATRNNFFDL